MERGGLDRRISAPSKSAPACGVMCCAPAEAGRSNPVGGPLCRTRTQTWSLHESRCDSRITHGVCGARPVASTVRNVGISSWDVILVVALMVVGSVAMSPQLQQVSSLPLDEQQEEAFDKELRSIRQQVCSLESRACGSGSWCSGCAHCLLVKPRRGSSFCVWSPDV